MGWKEWTATIKSWAVRNSAKYVYASIPKSRTDVDYDDQALDANRHYFRVWLPEMFLTKSRKWFKDWHPAVHASVEVEFEGRAGVSFSSVARAPEGTLAKGEFRNFPLTPLVPFKGGVVELQSSLVALEGKDHLSTFLGVLEDFSGLVSAPLSQAIELAGKVSGGLDKIVGATDGKIHLAHHQAFSSRGGGGSNDLAPGYFAVVLADQSQIDKNQLTVAEDQLYHRSQPLRDFDYMLLRIEGREERDDWRLKPIEDALEKARDALIEGKDDDAQMYRAQVLSTIFSSPDLTKTDQLRVALAVKQELAQIADLAHGAAPADDGPRTLEQIVAERAMAPHVAASESLSFAELLED